MDSVLAEAATGRWVPSIVSVRLKRTKKGRKGMKGDRLYYRVSEGVREGGSESKLEQ